MRNPTAGAVQFTRISPDLNNGLPPNLIEHYTRKNTIICNCLVIGVAIAILSKFWIGNLVDRDGFSEKLLTEELEHIFNV